MHILIDTSIDLRFQALRSHIKRIDMVLFTHAHVDHIHGLDELRQFNFLQGHEIPCYGSRETIQDLYTRYAYIFKKTQIGGGKPRVSFQVINAPLRINNLHIQPVEILHGELPILGYRINDMAYLTDCSHIPEHSKRHLQGLKLLILGALKRTPHPTHYNLEQAVEAVNELGAQQALFIHIAHELAHHYVNKELPPHIQLAYDGQIVEL